MLSELENALAGIPMDRAGTRLADKPVIADILSVDYAIGAVVAEKMGATPRSVRAILFDKNPHANWGLDWHQDRTIAVKERSEVAGFARWNVKQGIVHVEPPFRLLERMLTVRIHLDPVDESNGVLEVIPGSHKRGRIAEREVKRIVDEGPVVSCPALSGDCWVYRTPILHRSARSRSDGHRRVLQVDYSADDLPDRLEWRGV
ncbi:phytanoyl-CoA dioxygenase [Alteraurantiacibacter aquimixticola]|uniref:Phytanoyl-CoA dioxygenase n=2 Tax=Alteraurantiacibacter aquimixticola TaxID=2489173 RepID=A0A4T3EYY4_9SPHN|nr:phytanoyl-CoA dioxygenase [Alteraurantiacibacter aquimixticola]